MEAVSTFLLVNALLEVAKKLADKALVDPALEKGLTPFTRWLTQGVDQAEAEQTLFHAFQSGLESINLVSKDDTDLASSLERVGLNRLLSPNNHALREQVALGVLVATESDTPPAQTLVRALGWPWSKTTDLSKLLYHMRTYLGKSKEWQPLITMADNAALNQKMREIADAIAPLQAALVETPGGQALQIIQAEYNLSNDQLKEIEITYRQSLGDELEMLATQGLSPAQLPKSIQLPLQDVYLELGLIPLRSEKERDEEMKKLLEMREPERLKQEQEQVRQRVSDALAQRHQLVVVGKPGSGKTVSLKYIALMLAFGQSGATRLRLDKLYLPIYVRLADYANQLKKQGTLALETFLLDYIETYYPGKPYQNELLRHALENNLCLILLDGLDEVGDFGDDLLHGKTLRSTVLEEVRRFSNRRCKSVDRNHIVVTSRIEGYRSGDLPGFEEMELSPLMIPDELEDFLLRWFTAYEKEYKENLSASSAFQRARKRVDALMSDIMRSESVQRLAMNPLLLTILAMIHEMGTRLPEQRVRLYETVIKTMVENWRQANTRHTSSIYKIIPLPKIHQLLDSLAYWLHENEPGGAMPLDEWKRQILVLLLEDDDDEVTRRELGDAVDLFLRHAQQEVGLLTERSPGMLGFFHLTLEEYLAAVEIARHESDRRREMLTNHWQNPRWTEVILLAAGQLMLNTSPALDSFINDIRVLESEQLEAQGRAAVLAGKALVDVGPENFSRKVVRDVSQDLLEVAQDLPSKDRKTDPVTCYAPAIRAEAADTLDGLRYQPDDLYQYIPVAGLNLFFGKYPVTNAQYLRFLEADDFHAKEHWVSFPKFDEQSQSMAEDWGDASYTWLKDHWDERKKVYPRYWNDPRFGSMRPNVPIVGISWYEANAYAKWLLAHWADCEESKTLAQPGLLRLPTRAEWVQAAGGAKPKERFPWDEVGQAKTTQPEEAATIAEVLRCANVSESKIGRTTPIWMYPQGASQPYGLMDLGGNVWEWQANYSSDNRKFLGLSGGSWDFNWYVARVSALNFNNPSYRSYYIGFRLVALPS